MIGTRRTGIGIRLAALSALVAVVGLLALSASSPAAGARRTYVAERPGVSVRITATPTRILAIRLSSELTCSDGTTRSSSFAFTNLRGVKVGRGGRILFHHGGASAVTILKGRLLGGRIVGKFRRTNRVWPGNLRCGTISPTGRYVRFSAR